MCFLGFCEVHGFCDMETEKTDHGTYIWNETPGRTYDVQMCVFGPKPEYPGGKARRYCIGTHEWRDYRGDECISEATHRLTLIKEV